MKKNKEIVEAISSITQLGLSVVISFLLWIFIASWIRDEFSLGNEVMIAGIILGAASCVFSFIKYIKKMTGKEKENEK